MTDGTSGSWVDRRAAPRYRVRVPILFEGGEGMTRDISGTGVCFETANALAPGASIRIALPFDGDGAGERFTVTCEAHVVRVEKPDHGADRAYLVAARSGDIRFDPRDGWGGS
jgi:hypothetical protein